MIAVISLDAAVGLIDGAFALKAIPTMVSAIWLAPKVVAAAKVYLNKVDIGTYDTPTNSTSND